MRDTRAMALAVEPAFGLGWALWSFSCLIRDCQYHLGFRSPAVRQLRLAAGMVERIDEGKKGPAECERIEGSDETKDNVYIWSGCFRRVRQSNTMVRKDFGENAMALQVL